MAEDGNNETQDLGDKHMQAAYELRRVANVLEHVGYSHNAAFASVLRESSQANRRQKLKGY